MSLRLLRIACLLLVTGAQTLAAATETDARVIGGDPETDLAALRIVPERLVEITIGQSSKPQVAGYVLAIGTPIGLEQTVTFGIVSVLGRSSLGVDGYENLIQTGASINPGKPGSALEAGVRPASAADAAGLRPRDVILALDGVAIPDAATLRHQIGLMPPEQRVTLDSARDGKPMTVAAVPGPADQQVRSPSPGGRALCSCWPFRSCQPSVHRTQDE
jgi:S1-C subfamily serine protease